MRLLEALKKKFSHLSTGQLRDLIKNRQVTSQNRILKIGDLINDADTLKIPEAFLRTQLLPNPNVAPLILFEDDLFLFVEKPANLHSVAQSFADTESLANGILHTHPELAQIDPLECGLVHRLDFETSGVMVIAKNPETLKSLRQNFATRQIEKIYRTIVSGRPAQTGVYQAFVMPSKKSAIKMRLSQTESSDKTAITEILAVKNISSQSQNLQELTIRLVTGHRHQIRSHLAFLGHPIAGDTLYGSPLPPPFFLHAQSLKFLHDQKTYHVVSKK